MLPYTLHKDSSANRQAIAVVGMACRFPGANDYEQFWNNLKNGVNSIQEIPPERWDAASLFKPDAVSGQFISSKWCGLLDNIDAFDAHLFNISPREAHCMDPQQRILLEQAWACLEDSAIPLAALRNKQTAVYIGVMALDYLQEAAHQDYIVDSYSCLGTYECILANRISYFFGLSGESMSVDTACASSLCAIHQAITSLRTGKSDYAIAGGVSLDLHPLKYISFSKSRMLSPDGQCKTFDASANGYVPGEGAGLVLLQRLEDALDQKNNIHAIIRGSATNHTGRSSSLTAPRVEAQCSVIVNAYKDAGLTPDQITYTEAHGTGTSLGDPIEIESLNRAFKHFTAKTQYCYIGSVKTNIGHLEAAAGIAGVIKIILMMKNAAIPPTLNIKTINPIIQFSATPFVPVRELVDWNIKNDTVLRRAGVSSFGMGGSNAHIVIEQFSKAEYNPAPPKNQNICPKYPFLLSALTQKSLEGIIAKWRKFVSNPSTKSNDLYAICATIANGRKQHPFRTGALVSTTKDIALALEDVAISKENINKGDWAICYSDISLQSGTPIKEFKTMYTSLQSLLKSRIAEQSGIKQIYNTHWSSANAPLNKYFIARILGAALEDSIEDVPIITGIREGIYPALVSAGILCNNDCISLINGKKSYEACTIGSLKRKFWDPIDNCLIRPMDGAAARIAELFANIQVSPADILALRKQAIPLHAFQYTYKLYLAEWEKEIQRIGNSKALALMFEADPSQISEKQRLLLAIAFIESINKLARKWDLAERKPSLESRIYEITDLLIDAVISKRTVVQLLMNEPGASDVASQEVALNSDLFDLNKPYSFLRSAHYHARIFNADWLARVAHADMKKVLEFPTVYFDTSVKGGSNRIVCSYDRQLCENFQKSLVDLWLAGLSVRWDRIFPLDSYIKTPLPSYSFDRQHFWLRKPSQSTKRIMNKTGIINFNSNDQIFIDHIISGKPIAPVACMLDAAFTHSECNLITNFRAQKAIAINKNVELSFQQKDASGRFILKSANEVIASGEYVRARSASASDLVSKEYCLSAGSIHFEKSALYAALSASGYAYGPSLRIIHSATISDRAIHAHIEIPENVSSQFALAYAIDGALQAALAIAYSKPSQITTKLSVPHRFDAIRISRTPIPKHFEVYAATINNQDFNRPFAANITAYTHTREIVFQIQNVEFQPFGQDSKAPPPQIQNESISLLTPVWSPAPAKIVDTPSFRLAVIINIQGKAASLSLDSISTHFVCVRHGKAYEHIDIHTWQLDYQDQRQWRCLIEDLSEQYPSFDQWDFIFLPSLANPTITDFEPFAFFGNASITQLLFQICKELTRSSRKGLILAPYFLPAGNVDAAGSVPCAALAAYFKTLQVEYPRLCGRIVGIETVESLQQVISTELSEKSMYPWVVYNRNVRYRRAFRLVHEVSDKSSGMHSDGVYVVSGGTGGIGSAIVQYYLRHKPQAICVLGRRTFKALPDKAKSFLKQPEDNQPEDNHKVARAGYYQADVTDRESLSLALETIRSRHGPIRGVFHLAAVLEDSMLVNKAWATFQRVCLSKCAGAYMLNALTEQDPLEFFCAFSSIVALSGNVGQIDYATANAYLDAFIQYRSQCHTFPGKSIAINWPLWAGDGMGANKTAIAQLKRIGIHAIDPHEGIDALDAAMHGTQHQLVVLKEPKEKIINVIHGDEVGVEERKPPKMQRPLNVAASITSVIADVCGVGEEQIDSFTDISEYGVDSIAISDIAERLSALTNEAFHPSIITERPTINALAQYVTKIQADKNTHTNAANVVAAEQESAAQSFDQLRQFVRSEIADVLSVSAPTLDFESDIQEYGADSIAIADITEKLGTIFKTTIPHSLIIENPTIESLCRALRDKVIALPNELLSNDSNASEQAPYQEIDAQNVSSTNTSIQHNCAVPQNFRADIAIIGCSGRFPRSHTLELFWQNLANGQSMISEMPIERVDLEPFWNPEKGLPGKTYSRWAGTMDDIACFDSDFFKVKEDEASDIDPQQRIFLEVVQELWDRSGYSAEEIAGRNIGLFIGGHESNYGRRIHNRPKYAGRNGVTNVISNLIIGRIADFYDLHGPSEMIYTACSSSLVAVHKACASLRAGECEMAIAGGIELLLDEEWFLGFSAAKVLAGDGKCKVFDERADGFVLGEGAGAVLLKKLDRALAEGDTILGLIRGSATNNDGKTMGLTTPNQKAQIDVIQKGLYNAGVDPSTISYYEAHGTGTALGDPIEVRAATEVFRKHTKENGFCRIGSVKSNIGHLLAAAGIASLVKVLLQFKHDAIVPTINCGTPHPRFNFKSSPFIPALRFADWNGIQDRKIAAISSFGFGGTNCHMVVEKPDQSINVTARRKPLPVTRFKRRRFWIGLPIVNEQTALLEGIFCRVEAKKMSVKDAKKRCIELGIA
jgi:acyl transferase domain-containing protein/acyl carrier protein/NADP-dependent 3-hydroxy acid dehydrogenase YdfG